MMTMDEIREARKAASHEHSWKFHDSRGVSYCVVCFATLSDDGKTVTPNVVR